MFLCSFAKFAPKPFLTTIPRLCRANERCQTKTWRWKWVFVELAQRGLRSSTFIPHPPWQHRITIFENFPLSWSKILLLNRDAVLLANQRVVNIAGHSSHCNCYHYNYHLLEVEQKYYCTTRFPMFRHPCPSFHPANAPVAAGRRQSHQGAINWRRTGRPCDSFALSIEISRSAAGRIVPSLRISFIKFQKDITDLVRPFLKRKKQRGSLTKRIGVEQHRGGWHWESRKGKVVKAKNSTRDRDSAGDERKTRPRQDAFTDDDPGGGRPLQFSKGLFSDSPHC